MADGALLAASSVRFSTQADLDLDEIYDYLSRIPERHAARIIGDIDRTALSIGENPFIGSAESVLTRELGREVRSRPCGSYRIFYFVSRHSRDLRHPPHLPEPA
jgi:plasmid stabilization system protein ParE